MPSSEYFRVAPVNVHAHLRRHGHQHAGVAGHVHERSSATPDLTNNGKRELLSEAGDIVRRALGPRDTVTNQGPVDSSKDGSDNMINLLLIVLGLVFLSLICVCILFLFRRARRQQQMVQAETGNLPAYEDASKFSGSGKARGLTIETKHNGRSSVLYIGRDGRPMLQNPNSPPHSPDNVPEIHITFPDEVDDTGRPRSGRVLVVRVGDNATVGLEPYNDEQLPAYEKEAKGEFQSIDMDQIGGLKEKDRTIFQ